jgi:ribosomal protein L30/L7E
VAKAKKSEKKLQQDTPQIQGMIRQISFLLDVQEVEE